VDIFAEVNALGLPLGQYVVFGAGPLAAHGIRETNDVDLFVTPMLYQLLKADGWEEKELNNPPGGVCLFRGIYEADDTWRYGDYDPTPEAVISMADVMQGVPFAPLIEVSKWKRAFGRPKDAADVGLIERHLRQRDQCDSPCCSDSSGASS
jgi:hypothetical protein